MRMKNNLQTRKIWGREHFVFFLLLLLADAGASVVVEDDDHSVFGFS
jgi:hypothetical protein